MICVIAFESRRERECFLKLNSAMVGSKVMVQSGAGKMLEGASLSRGPQRRFLLLTLIQ